MGKISGKESMIKNYTIFSQLFPGIPSGCFFPLSWVGIPAAKIHFLKNKSVFSSWNIPQQQDIPVNCNLLY